MTAPLCIRHRAGPDLAAGLTGLQPVGPAAARRAALLEANGNIDVAFASFCDFFADQSFGQILSYSASNLAFQARYVTTYYGSCPNQNVGPSPYYLGSIWMSGFGPGADSSGNVYFTTGNGCISYYDVNSGAFSQAVLKLTPGLHLNDNTSTMFAPCHAQAESKSDLDLGSGGVTLLPDQGGSVPRLMVVGGKTVGRTCSTATCWAAGISRVPITSRTPPRPTAGCGAGTSRSNCRTVTPISRWAFAPACFWQL